MDEPDSKLKAADLIVKNAQPVTPLSDVVTPRVLDLMGMTPLEAWREMTAYAASQMSNMPQPEVQLILSGEQVVKWAHLLHASSPLPWTPEAGVTGTLWSNKGSDVVPRHKMGKVRFISPTLDPGSTFSFQAVVQYGGRRLMALFDSGADVTLVSAKAATACGLHIDACATVPVLVTASHEPIGVLGTVCARLDVGVVTIPGQCMLVMEGMSAGIDIILGSNWMA
jgi:hypothetical protein